MPETQAPRKIASISTTTILKVVGVFLALYFFYLIRDIILLLVISTIIAAALTPLVDWLYSRMKFPRGLSVVLVYAIFLGLVVLAFSFLLPRLINDVVDFGLNIGATQSRLQDNSSLIIRTLNQFGLSQAVESFGSGLAEISANIFQKTLGVLSGIFSTVSVLVISFYLVIEQDGLKDFVKSLTPPQYHTRINTVVQRVQKKLGRWLVGQLALMTSIFILTYIGLSIFGVKNALALALFAGLLEIVPYLGPIISAIPAVLLAFLQSPFLAILIIILYTAIQQFENYVLVPRIIGRSIGANPLVILIALLIGFRIAGIVGMLIAAPIVAVITVILEDYSGHKRLKEEN